MDAKTDMSRWIVAQRSTADGVKHTASLIPGRALILLAAASGMDRKENARNLVR